MLDKIREFRESFTKADGVTEPEAALALAYLASGFTIVGTRHDNKALTATGVIVGSIATTWYRHACIEREARTIAKQQRRVAYMNR